MKRLKMIFTIVTYIAIYIAAGYTLIVWIKKNTVRFQEIMVEALSHLKATSARIKYDKVWDDEYEESLKIEIEEYKDALRSKAWMSQNQAEVKKNQIIAYFIGWPVLFFIVLVSEFLKFFNIYQGKK